MTRREAIFEIGKVGFGTETEIVRIIGEGLFMEFCLIGLIKRGIASVDDNPETTWAITDSFQEEYDFYYKKPGEREIKLAKGYKQRPALIY